MAEQVAADQMRVRSAMVLPKWPLVAATTVGFLLGGVAQSIRELNGNAVATVMLTVVAMALFWMPLLTLLVRPLLRNDAEREYLSIGKQLMNEATVLYGIACPTCHVSGQVARATPSVHGPNAQFTCRRCGYTW